MRVAEHVVRAGLIGRRRLRVDLHGVSVFGPRGSHTLIRWEWVEEVAVDDDGVVIRGASAEVRFPPGAFGCDPPTLAGHLEAAQSITTRPEIIATLAAGA